MAATVFVLPAAPASATITAPERQMMNLVNAARIARGLRVLSWSSTLSDRARVHSRSMAARGTLFHTSNLASMFTGYSWSYGGENVGYGPTVSSVASAFMASPPHRANNLSTRYRVIGVGVAYRGAIPYITVEFYG